jgi:hypothetical protein
MREFLFAEFFQEVCITPGVLDSLMLTIIQVLPESG